MRQGGLSKCFFEDVCLPFLFTLKPELTLCSTETIIFVYNFPPCFIRAPTTQQLKFFICAIYDNTSDKNVNKREKETEE